MFIPLFVLVVAAAPGFGRLRARAWFSPALHGAMLSFVGLLVFVTVQFAVAIQWSPGSGALAALAFIPFLASWNLLGVNG